MFQIDRMDRSLGETLKQNVYGNVEYLTFPALEETGMVEHLFSTRLGGVSEGIFSSMNLSFSRGDNPEQVLTNYRRLEEILGCKAENMVASKQTHTVNIRYVTTEDKGKGIVRPLDYEDVDGMITDERGIALVTYFADCVPLYFVDPVHEAIGLAHSGWKGTVQEMGGHMVQAMQERFGTNPKELLAAIGPSICRDCYEVSEDVAEQFRPMEEENKELAEQICADGKLTLKKGEKPQLILPGKRPGKYQLDLWFANLLVLYKAGLLPQNISVTDICTCHNPAYLFSHRASEGKRGNLAAFLMLK